MERMELNQAWEYVSEIDIVYKSKVKASLRPSITSSEDAFKILISVWDMNKIEMLEAFKVLYLSRANKVLGVFHVSSGGITGTVADPRLIFVTALKANACGLILCHNHPSGSLKPSIADEELTFKISQAGKFLDIKVFDHLIINADTYFSFADEGLL